MRTFAFFVSLFFAHSHLFCQERIDVAEQTVRLGAKEEQVLYYGFAQGDKIVFNFEEVNGREVSEVEIAEFPDNSRYKEYQIKTIKDKILTAPRNGVYKFRFFNSALLKERTCRIKIQRIPQSDKTSNFNTGIKWVEKFDTTYDIRTETVVIRYDTIRKQKTRRVLASVDTSFIQVLDRVERIHSMTNGNGNTSTVLFQLPENSYSPNAFLPYKATETISWAYSIAVDDSGKAWYEDANKRASAVAASKLSVKLGLISSGYGALAVLALEGYSAFAKPPQGENVRFQFYNGQSPTSIYGDAVAASGRVTAVNQGDFAIRLENDNVIDGINVDIKILAVTVTRTWKDEGYTVEEIEPIKEKKSSKIPKITKSKVPVLVED